MGAIEIILLVVFIIVSVLLIGIVLIQNEEGGGMGGLFGGAGSSTFGSRSQTVITKTTYVLVTLFFVVSFSLAYANKSSNIDYLESAAQEVKTEDTAGAKNWLDSEETILQSSTEAETSEAVETKAETSEAVETKAETEVSPETDTVEGSVANTSNTPASEN